MANPSYLTSALVTQEIPQTELNFHLYIYQWVRGADVNQKAVVRSGFGTVYAMDWTIFDSPDPNAKLVARVRGVLNQCDMKVDDSWLVTASIVFVDQRYKGSTLKVSGSYEVNEDFVGEWAIVGGTGEFGFAQGVGTFKKIKEMGNGNIREFKFRVRCPTSQKPPVPTPPSEVGPEGGKGGDAFEIPKQPEPRRLESVTIRSGDVIDAIAFSYVDQDGKKQTVGPWGGKDGLEETITFGSTETLKKVLGTTGNFGGNVVVTSLSFVTDGKTYGPFGKGIGSTPSTFSIPDKDASVVGLFGRAGRFVDAIGAYVADQ